MKHLQLKLLLRHVAKSKNLGWASSNAARCRWPAAPSDLPKSGGVYAPPLATCLLLINDIDIGLIYV